MKQATKAFPLDNGTVFEGQVLPDGHPAVERFPDNFRDVTDETDPEVLDGQAVDDMSTGDTVEPAKGDSGDDADDESGKAGPAKQTAAKSSAKAPADS